MANQYPAVFVHGLFGFGAKELGPLNYWGNALKVDSALEERYEASVGPISSAHDRACELAAQLKGTRVDYGAAHSKECGHQRFGTDYTSRGFVPDWSQERPVHLVGHSLGAPSIRCLQHLLEQDYWGWGSNHRWVHSINTISGVNNGSTLAFMFGADEETGLMNKASLATPILAAIQLFSAATGRIPSLESIYDFDVEHWGFRRQKSETLESYSMRMAKSRFLWEKDNAAWSLTLQGAFEDNQKWQTHPGTWYFSYVTEQTTPDFRGRHWPSLGMNPAMAAAAIYIGQKAFSHSPLPDFDFDSSDWWENDGLVSTYSQLYPRTAGRHPVGREFDQATPIDVFRPGRWNFCWEREMDHLDITLSPAPKQIPRQKQFYRSLFQRLASLPK